MMTLDRLNRLYAARAIRKCGGDLRKAATLLGIGRATLYRWFPAVPESAMTKDQHTRKKELENAQARYLVAYHWIWNQDGWTHPKTPGYRYRANDAVQLTLANPLEYSL